MSLSAPSSPVPSVSPPLASPPAVPPPPAPTRPRRSTTGLDLPPFVRVRPWADAVIERVGHDPRSSYVERFWLPIVGPSAVWLLRLLANELEREPEGFLADTHEMARAIGLGNGGGRQAPFARTVERLGAFGMVQVVDGSTVMARTRVAPLTNRQLGRLSPGLRAQHEAFVQAQPAEPAVEAMRRRARALALSLLQLGEDLEDTERQLHRWRFHPAIAHEALRWARAAHEADPATEAQRGLVKVRASSSSVRTP